MIRPPLLYLSPDDVRRALPMAAAIEAMRSAFKELGGGTVIMPPRLRLDAKEEQGVVLVMPSLSGGLSRLALKVLTLYENNPKAGLPFIQALVILSDASTGTSLAILDGGALTALRTGAVGGVAADVLARPDAAVAAIFGAGPQARAQLEALAAVRELREARVYDPNKDAAAAFVQEMSSRLGLVVSAAPDAASALRGADLVATATTSSRPVFADGDIGEGGHINAVGVYQPDRAEIPPHTVRWARVVVDQREAALEEAGDLLQPMADGLFGPEHISTELGEILLGRAPGRTSDAEITLFKSVGLAVQDLYAAAAAYDSAVRAGIGIELPR
jgi:ornithine cyclodeaminase/alanine dehydrogenase-like protein (mu-crystallin family)